jgi:hypothetical protein
MHPRSFIKSAGQTDTNSRLWFLLAIVFFSRLLLAFAIWKINGSSGFFTPDTMGYVGPAESLLHGSFSYLGQPEILRTPGYPLFLVPGVALKHLVVISLLENLLFAVASSWLIWKIVTDLLPGTKAAFWAVLFYCFEPIGFLYSEKILSETLFTTLFLLFVWVLVRFLREPTYARLVLSALILGCATYVRPVPIYLALWLIPLFFFFPRTLSWRQRASGAILFPVIFGLTLVPWVVRNTAVAHYQSFSSTSDLNLYFLAAAAVQARLEHRSFSQVQDEWGYSNGEHYFRMHPEQRGWSQAQIARFWGTEARRIIAPHVLTYSLIHARGCAMVMFNPGVSNLLTVVGLYPGRGGALSSEVTDHGLFRATLWLLRQYPVTAVALPLMTAQVLLYYALAVVGLRRMAFDVGLLFSVLFLYFVVVSGFPAAEARYRVPVMPLVSICAGVAIANWRISKPAATGQVREKMELNVTA